MMHLNLECKVGRAPVQGLGTFDYKDPAQAEANCTALQVQKTAELSASGVDIARVKFERVYVDSNGKRYATPTVKKGK